MTTTTLKLWRIGFALGVLAVVVTAVWLLVAVTIEYARYHA